MATTIYTYLHNDDLNGSRIVSMDDLLKAGQADVSVLKTDDKWFGVTYKEDKDSVKKAFEKLVSDGVYESPLFG